MLNYQNGQHYFNLAEQERNNKNFEKAIYNYSTSLNFLMELKEDYLIPQAIFGRAKSYFMIKQYGNVINDLTNELIPNELNYELLNYRAYSYFVMGYFAKAEKDFTKVLITEPENTFALRWRGELYLNTWKLNKAKVDFEKYIEVCKATEDVLNNLHFINSYQNKYNAKIQSVINENTFRDLPQVGEKNGNLAKEKSLKNKIGSKLKYLPSLENQFNFSNHEDLPITEQLYQHSSIIKSVHISDDSNYLISGDEVGNVILWFLPHQQLIFTVNILSQIFKVQISKNNRYCASIDCNSRIHIWNIITKKLLKIIEKDDWLAGLDENPYLSLNFEFSPDEKNLCITRLDINEVFNEVYISIVDLENLSITKFDGQQYKNKFGRITGIHYLSNIEFGIELKPYWSSDPKCTFIKVDISTETITSIHHHNKWVNDDFIITRNKNLLMHSRSNFYGGGGENGPDGDYFYFRLTRANNQEIIREKVLFDCSVYPDSLTANGEKALGMSKGILGIIGLFNLKESNIEFYYCPVELSIIPSSKHFPTSPVIFPKKVNNMEISPSGSFAILSIDKSIYYLDLE